MVPVLKSQGVKVETNLKEQRAKRTNSFSLIKFVEAISTERRLINQ